MIFLNKNYKICVSKYYSFIKIIFLKWYWRYKFQNSKIGELLIITIKIIDLRFKRYKLISLMIMIGDFVNQYIFIDKI